MSVGFGFSAGDFIAALQLVSTVIDALRDSGDSSTEYRALISQLFTLETALLKVKRLEVDDENHAEVIALRQAACQCQTTIDAFWEKIKKYQPSLREGGSGNRAKDSWRKIRWVVCKKDDLVKFKADLVGHTESIELLLLTLHMGSTRIEGKRQEENHKTLAGKMQEGYFGCMQKLSSVIDRVSTGVEQGKKILEMTAKVIQTNLDVFYIVLNIQSIITRIPGQVERQQPVYFIDALGRHTPFNLEFILSAEALTHVLRANFRNIGSGSQKIDRGEFAIQDTGLKSDIDLTGPWERCFRPGQRVDMSMVFISKKDPSQSCPACHHDNRHGFEEDQDVECQKCGVTFRRTVTRVFENKKTPEISVVVTPPSARDPSFLILNDGRGEPKRKRVNDEDEEMALFRRVRVKTSVVLPSEAPRSSPQINLRTRHIDDDKKAFVRNHLPEAEIHRRKAEVIPEKSAAHPTNGTADALRASTEFLPSNASNAKRFLPLVSNKRPHRRKVMPWTLTAKEDFKGRLFLRGNSEPEDGEIVAESIPPPQYRWSQIREGARRRVAERQSKEQISYRLSLDRDDGDTSGEEDIESRVARIKARVAELTGNTEDPTMRPDSKSDRMRKRKTYSDHEETTASKRHQPSSINDAIPDPTDLGFPLSQATDLAPFIFS